MNESISMRKKRHVFDDVLEIKTEEGSFNIDKQNRALLHARLLQQTEYLLEAIEFHDIDVCGAYHIGVEELIRQFIFPVLWNLNSDVDAVLIQNQNKVLALEYCIDVMVRYIQNLQPLTVESHVEKEPALKLNWVYVGEQFLNDMYVSKRAEIVVCIDFINYELIVTKNHH